jgi:hypothetical protein
MSNEEELLKVRSNYPEPSGWDTAKAWLWRDEQIALGVQRVLENHLIEQFIEYAGKESDGPQKLLSKRNFSWSRYSKLLNKIAVNCSTDLFSELLWKTYAWAKINAANEKANYLHYATTPANLVTMFATRGLLKPLLTDLIVVDNIDNSLIILKRTFKGIEKDPKATALLVLDFIYTVRDLSNENKVLSAFFEGFEVNVQYGLTSNTRASLTWKASPMLNAIAQAKGRPLVDLYEIFVRNLFSAAREANRDEWGAWQRKYDQEFRLWINVMQSGMFKSDQVVEYDESVQ